MNDRWKSSDILSWHPSRADLYDYAEAVQHGEDPPTASIAQHVLQCDVCLKEVDRIRETVRVADLAGGIEPGREFTAGVLLAVRQERGLNRLAEESRDWRPQGKAVGYATAIVLVASLSVVAVRYADVQVMFLDSGSAQTTSASVFSLDVLSQATPAEALLGPVVLFGEAPSSAWEAAKHEAVQSWDAEIDEALDALRSNPACVRAADLVNNNRERRAETLKVLYAERSL